MAHLALYRSWRPKTFAEIVGQDYIVTALRQAVINEEIAHALLFTGTRGTGKTSLAKIYARAINCLNPQNGNPCNDCSVCEGALNGSLLDIMEIDAASNNSVDNIRSLTDEVHFTPTQARYKVYIIDEVHMLSNSAFNALLKTLEEPPSHAVFILATTDPQRIPATILSRCQRFDLKRIGDKDMLARLRKIADAEQIIIDDEALLTICQLSDGAMRDAISLLDQTDAASPDGITRKDILDLVGMVDDNFMGQIIASLIRGDAGALLGYIDEMVLQGEDIYRFTMDLIRYYRNILITQTTRRPQDILRVPRQTQAGLKQLAGVYSQKRIVEIIQFLAAAARELKQAPDPRINLEITLIQLLNLSRVPDEILNSTGQEHADTPEKKRDLTSTAEVSASESPRDAKPAEINDDVRTPVPSRPLPKQEADPTNMQEAQEPVTYDEDHESSEGPYPGGELDTVDEDELEQAPLEDPEDESFTSQAEPEIPDEDPEPTEDYIEETSLEEDQFEEASEPPLPDTMPDLASFLQKLGQSLIAEFSNAEAAILIRSPKASWEGKNLRFDFAPEQDKLYNVLMKPELRRVIHQALHKLEPALEPDLILHLNEKGERLPDGTVDQTPEWVKKVRAVAEEFNIPLEIRD